MTTTTRDAVETAIDLATQNGALLHAIGTTFARCRTCRQLSKRAARVGDGLCTHCAAKRYGRQLGSTLDVRV